MAPAGYTKQKRGDEIVFKKTHKNGEVTEIRLGPIVNGGGRWFGWVSDEGRTEELGEFGSKQAALEAARTWASQNPKGLGAKTGMGNIIPGADSKGPFFSF